MGASKSKTISTTFGDFSGGLNTFDEPSEIADNQVQACMDAIFSSKGTKRRKGVEGVTNALPSYMRALKPYLQEDDTERLIAVSDSKVYDVLNSMTNRGSITGDGNAEIQSYKDKAWICNGSGLWKLEQTNLYQVGISAPVAGSGAAVSGGSLADGTYACYIAYARKVSGTIVLYGSGYEVGSIVVAAPNSTIRISSFAASTDSQVDTRVVFLREPGGTNYYYYGEAANAGGADIDIVDDSNKNTAILYSVVSAPNLIPGAVEHINIHKGTLVASVGSLAYFSLRAGTVYDLEKFDTAFNTKAIPFDITGIFSVGDNLYFNTEAGIFLLPEGDSLAELVHIEKRLFWHHMNTVDMQRGVLWGLTNDGVRFFDGNTFSPSLTVKIEEEVQTIYRNSTVNNRPCGAVIRDNNRTEYHLSYLDSDVNSIRNNRRLVLPLERVSFFDTGHVDAPWEMWSNGANHIAVMKDGIYYNSQTDSAASVVYKNNNSHTYDVDVFIPDGTYTTENVDTEISVTTKLFIPDNDMSMKARWQMLRSFAKVAKAMTVRVVIGDSFSKDDSVSIGTGAGAAIWDAAIWDDAVFGAESLIRVPKRLSRKLKGFSVYLVITQDADDINFELNKVVLQGFTRNVRWS